MGSWFRGDSANDAPLLVLASSFVLISCAVLSAWASGRLSSDGSLRDDGLNLWRGTFDGSKYSPGQFDLALNRDIPGLVLIVQICAAVGLVYALFLAIERLHSSLQDAGCIRIESSDDFAAVNNELQLLQARWRRAGSYAPLTLVLSFVAPLILSWRLRTRHIGDIAGTYNTGAANDMWWASSEPFKIGAIAWIFMAGVGIYVVYVEAVVGLSYAAFLRRVRHRYRLGANPYRYDQFYGWSVLRRAVTAQQLGVVSTIFVLISAWFFLAPATGGVSAAFILGGFGIVVVYVFSVTTSGFRRLALDYRNQRVDYLVEKAAIDPDRSSEVELLRPRSYLDELELWRDVPASPFRRRWLALGLAVALVSVAASIAQIADWLG